MIKPEEIHVPIISFNKKAPVNPGLFCDITSGFGEILLHKLFPYITGL